MSTDTPTELDILLERLGLGKSSSEASAFGSDSARAHASHQQQAPCTANRPPSPSTPPQASHLERGDTSGPLGVTSTSRPAASDGEAYFPWVPESLEDSGLLPSEVTEIILKILLNRGVETGAQIAGQFGLRFGIVEVLLRQLKVERLVLYKGSATGHDYQYELTDLGRTNARELSERGSYFGTAPVPLKQYVASVKAQSLALQKPPLRAIRAAFEGMHVKDHLLSNIGQAIHSGRGMFLFGPPGNGKTTLAERVTRSFRDNIWIPRAISVSGEVFRLFDPNLHRPIPADPELDADGRWVQIKRPTIIAGGELRMDDLEIQYIRGTGIGEAPLQLKANGGTLLIDDFGRQRMNIDELLNRWIVPLEQRHDYLHLESGRTIQVPFDQLIIFSSNLEPRDLVDDAFLRRIPYKIAVCDPTEQEFRRLFTEVAESMKFQIEPGVLDYLVSEHFVRTQRPLRYCHPRDLCRQVENRCSLHELPRIITKEAIDQAVENYFSIV